VRCKTAKGGDLQIHQRVEECDDGRYLGLGMFHEYENIFGYCETDRRLRLPRRHQHPLDAAQGRLSPIPVRV